MAPKKTSKTAIPQPLPDVEALNKLSVPLTPLRYKIAELLRNDIVEYPLGDLMLLIKEVLKNKEEE